MSDAVVTNILAILFMAILFSVLFAEDGDRRIAFLIGTYMFTGLSVVGWIAFVIHHLVVKYW